MSDHELWTAVDGLIEETLLDDDPVLEEALERGRRANLPQIQVSAPHAKLLYLLARAIRAERILEVGTLGGYSSIWLARALPPGGRLVTIEVDPDHAAVAAANFVSAGVADKVVLRTGAALDVLPEIGAEGLGPFDLTFIDADKPNNSNYLEWAAKLSRTGGVIVLDNVVRGGAVLDRKVDASAASAPDAIEWLGGRADIDSTVIQTVGTKGYDGFAIAIVS